MCVNNIFMKSNGGVSLFYERFIDFLVRIIGKIVESFSVGLRFMIVHFLILKTHLKIVNVNYLFERGII